MNKTTLISGIVIIALVSVVTAIFISDTDEGIEVSGTKPTSSKSDLVIKDNAQNQQSTKETQIVKTDKTTKSKISKKKTTAKPKAKKPVAEEESETKVSRVRWPGMKYRMVRVTKEEKIEPVTELRTWSRKQWVDKVTDLRKADKDKLAEQYISAYNQQYPKKDLNNYLK